jgi:hypothetical protein
MKSSIEVEVQDIDHLGLIAPHSAGYLRQKIILVTR